MSEVHSPSCRPPHPASPLEMTLSWSCGDTPIHWTSRPGASCVAGATLVWGMHRDMRPCLTAGEPNLVDEVP